MMFVGLRLCASSQGIPVHHPRSLSVKSVYSNEYVPAGVKAAPAGVVVLLKRKWRHAEEGVGLEKAVFIRPRFFAVLLPGRFTIVLPVYYTKKEGTGVRWSRIR